MSKRRKIDHHTQRQSPAPGLRLAPPNQAPHTQPRIRTLRISAIPLCVTEDDFRTYLKELLGYDDFILSLVPSQYYAVATVTLTKGEPAELRQCTPANKIYPHHRETSSDLVVDCDFLGMTPLYTAKEPTVE